MSRIEAATGPPLAEHPPRRARLQGLFGPGGLTAAAAVLAVVGLLVWNTSLCEENEDLRADLQTRQAYEMRGSGIAQNVRGEVVRMRDGRAVLMVENLPSPPEGQVYETWLMRNDVPNLPASSNRTTGSPPRP